MHSNGNDDSVNHTGAFISVKHSLIKTVRQGSQRSSHAEQENPRAHRLLSGIDRE